MSKNMRFKITLLSLFLLLSIVSCQRKGRQIFIDKLDYSLIIENSFRVSPDCKHIAYVIRIDERECVVSNGKKGRKYHDIFEDMLLFSADGKKAAYMAKQGRSWFLVLDGEEGKSSDSIIFKSSIIFHSSDALHYLAIKNSCIYLLHKEIS
jgi:hypothetical protein